MNKDDYNAKRDSLVKERIELMNTLEAQEDFPEDETLKAYRRNKILIINLDEQWDIQQRRKKK